MANQTLFPEKLATKLKKGKYQLVGQHSAVKKCRWLHKSLLDQGSCYKHQFYGIESWRCLQMTPTIANCTLRCLFCWRVQPDDINVTIDETRRLDWDDPISIIDASVNAQKRILSGYKAHSAVNKRKYLEAGQPRHAAISLAGEPTLYPSLGDLIYEFHKKYFTTFLVTNGTVPKALENLSTEPTQLYISLCAPDKNTFKKVCRPQVNRAWTKINESLELLSSFSCPTVIRLTLVRHLNLMNTSKYAKLILQAQPTYIEPKAYVYVGASRKRLQFKNMPTHKEIRQFGYDLSGLTGYNILDESIPSRVILLSQLKQPQKLA